MNVSELLMDRRLPRSLLMRSRAIVCNDGFQMSVQASEFYYCCPQTNDGPWTHFEVGFPSRVEPLLLPYIDVSGDDLTGAVYGYVPESVVVAVIEAHGGEVTTDERS